MTSRHAIILSGKKSDKKYILGLERFSDYADYLIINYDIAGDWLEALKAGYPWKAIIMDEVHMLKTHTSIRSKA